MLEEDGRLRNLVWTVGVTSYAEQGESPSVVSFGLDGLPSYPISIEVFCQVRVNFFLLDRLSKGDCTQ